MCGVSFQRERIVGKVGHGDGGTTPNVIETLNCILQTGEPYGP